MAGDDVTREAEQRLGAALERIADMAHEGLSLAAARPPAPEPVPEPAGAPGTTELVARLDSLIDRLRDALAS